MNKHRYEVSLKQQVLWKTQVLRMGNEFFLPSIFCAVFISVPFPWVWLKVYFLSSTRTNITLEDRTLHPSAGTEDTRARPGTGHGIASSPERWEVRG